MEYFISHMTKRNTINGFIPTYLTWDLFLEIAIGPLVMVGLLLDIIGDE